MVYLLDRSISMGPSGGLDLARADLVRSLRSLPVGTLFQVIPYNRFAEPLRLGGRSDLVAATPENVAAAAVSLGLLEAEGGTDHARALRRGLALRPDLLFLATDADDLAEADVLAITRINQMRTILHVLDLGHGQPRPDNPLVRLATLNRGVCRRALAP